MFIQTPIEILNNDMRQCEHMINRKIPDMNKNSEFVKGLIDAYG